jgi:N-acetylglucosamine-6-sulfatase
MSYASLDRGLEMMGLRTSTRGGSAALALVALAIALLVNPVANVPAGAALVKPNIVLVLTDDQTMESVGRMPYVSSRTDWISFDRAYVENALCCPSRATILTGRYDTHTRVGNNVQGNLFDERQTLPVWLSDAGYRTGMFGKYLNGYPFGRGLYTPPGWTEWQVAYNAPNWGIYSQYHYKLNSNGVSHDHLRAASDYMPTVLTGKLRTWVSAQAAAHRPFFAAFTPTATHSPWTASPTRKGTLATASVAASPSFNVVAPDQPAYLKSQPLWDRSVMDAERRKEWESAASVDDAIRRIDDALRTAGVYDNTIVIFMTDNGYSFGNHRWERKRCEFTECGATPMLIRYPGVPGRHDTSHLISNVDIAQTISELTGATTPAGRDGRSFAPLVLGQTVPWRQSLLLHWPGGDMEGRAGRPDSMPQFWGVLGQPSSGGLWKYVELDTGERELYDEVADPYELDNRAGDADTTAVQAEMARMLATLESQAGVTTSGGALRADVPVAGTLGADLD